MLAAVLLLVAAVLVAPVGGEDGDIGRYLTAWRLANRGVTDEIVGLTFLGSGEALLTMMALAAAWLVWRDESMKAAWMVATIMGGRTLIAVLKQVFDRPRPELSGRVVETTSFSFPSGHAGNSMITFLALALWLAPARWRGPAVAAALLASAMVGLSRPLLGVHWMSDVLAGWGMGMAWVMLGWWVSQRALGKA